ncbi:MAG: hypothetical protein Q8O30_04635 [Candidatus Omnitrophota bacterium]|nr:hypothetical protein [Candidatus Omnitrophota bacterium]
MPTNAGIPFLLFPIKSFGVQVEIKDISDDKYFQAVHVRNIGYVVGSAKVQYRRKLKERLKKEDSETVTKCHGLKMLATAFSRHAQ